MSEIHRGTGAITVGDLIEYLHTVPGHLPVAITGHGQGLLDVAATDSAIFAIDEDGVSLTQDGVLTLSTAS